MWRRKITFGLVAAGLTAIIASFVPTHAVAAPTGSNTGAIYTTNLACMGVNVNQFPTKTDVYLDGGPHNNNASGLPDGTYFVQVTNPSGSEVLGQSVTDDVKVVGGRFETCYRLWDLVFQPTAFTTQGYSDTTNNGGVYKVWLSTDGGFIHRFSKTDNFKVNSDCTSQCLPPAGDLGISKTAIPSFDRAYTWTIAKTACADGISPCTQTVNQSGSSVKFNYTVTATPSTPTDGHWIVTGIITLTNPNNANVTGVDLTDAVDNGGVCTVDAPATGLIVPASGSLFKNYSCAYATATTSPGAGVNTATATWPEQTIGVAPNQLLLLAGSSSFNASFDFGAATPNLVDSCASVTDPLGGGSLGNACVGNAASQTYNYSFLVPATPGTCVSQPNTASLLTSTSETPGAASQLVTVCTGANLTVAKTATPAFTRTFGWTIGKSVDKTKVEQVGGSATFNYAVVVTHDAGTDSAWQVTGKVTASNPNNWESITADLTDAVDNGGSCSVTNGTAVLIPASSSVDRDYACTYASAPGSKAGANTATATWNSAAAFTPDGSASGGQGFTFDDGSTGNPTLAHSSVNVTDTFAGSLGTATLTDPNPKTFMYSRTIAVPPTGCVSYPNTASFTTNDPGDTAPQTGSASQAVSVCGPAKTGALTIGFWQNKNGQGIITGGSSTSGVCNSATWLRNYNPFKDLSSSSTCSQVATYVTGIIKGASASGSTMNPMLKAQMLATALDVYFSDPALGGNKIGAPGPLGGVAIDLTKVCKNIPPCTLFENTSSSFGNASSLTVNQLLMYASGQSNSGGTTWYGNVKTVQELAKDTFDAINNEVAFGV